MMKRILSWLCVFLVMSTQVALANDFYTPSGNPQPNTLASSATMRAEFSLIEDGFDKFPSMSGSGSLPVFINPAETALEAVSAASARSKLGLIIGTDVQAYDANLPVWPVGVSAAEVGFLDGVTSAIQTQLNTLTSNVALKANIASPSLTGDPTAPTPTAGDNDTSIATTAYVQSAVSSSSASAKNWLIDPEFLNNHGLATMGGVAVNDDPSGPVWMTDIWQLFNNSVAVSSNTVNMRSETDGDITLISMYNDDLGTYQMGFGQETFELTSLNGQTVTVSLTVESLSYAVQIGGMGMTPQTISSTGAWSYSFTAGSTGDIYIFMDVPGLTTRTPNFRFKDFKVEIGSVATPFEKTDANEERRKIDRYYQAFECGIGYTGTSYHLGLDVDDGMMMVPTSDYMYGAVDLKPNGLLYVDNGGTQKPIASCSNVHGAPGLIVFQCSAAGGLTGDWDTYCINDGFWWLDARQDIN